MDDDIDKILDELFQDPESQKESCRAFDSLIEVYCHYYKKGEKSLYEDCECEVWLKPLDSTIIDFKRSQVTLVNGEKEWVEDYDIIFAEDNIMFEFKVLTTDNNPFSGMEYLIDMAGEYDIFKEYLNDFYKHAEILKTKNLTTIKFLTAWKYRIWTDNWTGEWEEDYTFAGFINYRKLNSYLFQCLTNDINIMEGKNEKEKL